MAHRLDDLIDKLFKEERDRALARAWAEKLDADGIGDRAEALIREAAATTQRADGTEMTPRQARDYMADFARTIGVADHHVQASLTWLESADPANAADPTAAASHEEIERKMARQEADRIEQTMKQDPPQILVIARPAGEISRRACALGRATAGAGRAGWATRARCAPQPVAAPAPAAPPDPGAGTLAAPVARPSA